MNFKLEAFINSTTCFYSYAYWKNGVCGDLHFATCSVNRGKIIDVAHKIQYNLNQIHIEQ